MKKMSDLLKAHISGMAGKIYFKSGKYVVSHDIPAPAQRI